METMVFWGFLRSETQISPAHCSPSVGASSAFVAGIRSQELWVLILIFVLTGGNLSHSLFLWASVFLCHEGADLEEK